MTKKMKKSVKAVIIIAAFLFHFILYYYFSRHWGPDFVFSLIIPLFVSGYLTGIRGSIFFGLLSHPVNVLFLYIYGNNPGILSITPFNLGTWAAALISTILFGLLRDMNQDYKEALLALHESNAELSKAITEINTLSDLLPM